MQRTAGVNRQRFNVEEFYAGQWRVIKDGCYSQGHADSQMAFLQKDHPEIQFRVVPATVFVPHRMNYR